MGVFDQAPSAWDLMPILNTSAVLSVPEKSPYKTIEDLLAASKDRVLNMASGTGGSVWSLKASIFADAAGITFNRLNYEGSVPSQTAALSGEVEYVVTGLAEQMEYIKSGKLRPLAMIEDTPAEVEGFGTIPAITDAVPSFADHIQPMQYSISWQPFRPRPDPPFPSCERKGNMLLHQVLSTIGREGQ